MPKTNKKPRRVNRSAARKTTTGKGRNEVSEPIYKAEPAYININEHQAEIAAKSRFLWLIVAVFSVCLIIFWLAMLRINIQKQTADIGFAQIGQQIAQSLARFDTEIKDRSAPQTISADDLAAIKTNIEDQIKNNPDSSLWPTHELATLGISLQYPDAWNKSVKNGGIILSDTAPGSIPASSNNEGSIYIKTAPNPQRLNLNSWLVQRKDDPTRYNNFSFYSTSSLEGIFYKTSAETSSQMLIYINSTSTKTVWIIDTLAIGDLKYYEPLMEEIVRTIKIIK